MAQPTNTWVCIILSFFCLHTLMGCVYTQPVSTSAELPYEQTAVADSVASFNVAADSIASLSKAQEPEEGHNSTEPIHQDEELTRKELLMLQADKWAGTPHKWGGTSESGIDCSALVQHIFAESFNVVLPRTTREQVRRGSKISPSQLEIGDLLFYRIKRGKRHVGIYVGNDTILHASASEGVAISSINEKYWRSRFWMARRVLPPEEGMEEEKPQKKVQVTW